MKKLYDKLQELGVNSQYHANPGKHTMGYWMSHVEEYLTFFGS